jgi:iron complex transport system substrate-binding protein
MTRTWLRLALCCLAALMAAPSWAAVVHRDDAGRAVRLAATPRRVVTLAPSLTEYVYAVGAGDLLVGTVDTSDYPSAAQRVPRIGDYQRLDVERILALKPDLVLVWSSGNPGRDLAQLEAAGVPLFRVEPRRLGDVARLLERVGALLGRGEQGAAQAHALRRELAVLRIRYGQAEPVSVFFQVWSSPLMTLNGQHLTSDMLALCGGRNVFAGLPSLAPQVTLESVIAADAEVFVTAAGSVDDRPAWRRDPTHLAWAPWQPFQRLRAVQRRWMYTVPADLVSRQGPRIAEGARALCGLLDEVRRERGSNGSPR